VEDSWKDAGSSKLGGDGTADELCVVGTCCVLVALFLPAGSTAAKASMPLATFWGRLDLATVEVVVLSSGVDFGLGDVDLDWVVGVKTSYFVDHFRVFS